MITSNGSPKITYDCSDKSKNSHFDNLSQDIIFELEQLNKKQFEVKNVVFGKSSNVMNTSLSLNEKLAEIEKIHIANNNERAQKEV